jgi:signal transduction histidine kinase
LRLQPKAFSIAARFCFARKVLGLWAGLLLIVSAISVAAATPPGAVQPGLTQAKVVATHRGPILWFTQADYVFADQYAIPTSGWFTDRAGLTVARDELPPPLHGPKVLWARMRFDRAAVGREPLAIYTQGNHDRIRIFLNGVEIYRDFASPNDQIDTWYQPILIPIAQGGLHNGVNEIIVSAVSDYDLGTGRFEIGPNRSLALQANAAYAARIDLPRKVNFAMIMLAYGAFVYWLFGRREIEFLLISLASFLWFISNYRFLFPSSPFGELALSTVPEYFVFLASATTLVFSAEFVKFERRRWVLGAVAGTGALLTLLYMFAPHRHIADAGAYAISALLIAQATAMTFRVWRRSRSLEHLALSISLTLLTIASVHDFGRLWYIRASNGLGFFLQPYEGFILCAGFLASFGRRASNAFGALRQLNADLEARVIQAREELAVSEAKRRELEVARAIESERERLLREIHDGIGSNLVTALRVAEQQHQPANTIKTLRRALSDLKITIDSLEPVEGDLVALLANLRHRMEGDLLDAGLVCRWRVTDCRPLAWLDAPNALHVLRIFQEAVGNIMAHAGAEGLEIGCQEESFDGRPGIVAYVSDDGHGFDPDGPAVGKGLSNMRSRARVLHGRFDCVSVAGEGTRISIWLPYTRDETARLGT